jgi:hypothetical protein
MENNENPAVTVPPKDHDRIMAAQFRADLWEAYKRAGGVDFLAQFAKEFPDKFVAAVVKSMPARVEQQNDVVITINWASPDRLSYRNAQIIENTADVVPPAQVAEQVPWRELDPNSVAAAVEATKKNSGPKSSPVSEAKPVSEPAPKEPPAQAAAAPMQAEQTEAKGTLPPWTIELPDSPGPKPEFINGQVWYFGDDEDGRMARAREKALEKEAKQTKARP